MSEETPHKHKPMHHSESPSEANSKKLDTLSSQVHEILVYIKGTDDGSLPGLNRYVIEIREVLFGVKGRNGVIQRVDIMWRIYIWLLCSLSGAFGYWLKSFVETFTSSRRP